VLSAYWILGLAGGWAVLALAMNLPRQRRLRKLAASRIGTDSFAAFSEMLPGMPEALLRGLYAAVQRLVPVKDFPLRPDDNLWTTLEIDEGSLDVLLENLVAEGFTEASVVPEPGPQIATVADLARVVWRHRQQNGG